MLNSILNATNIEKSKTEELLAAAELQNIELRDRIDELTNVESKVSEWKMMNKFEINNRQLSSFLALKRYAHHYVLLYVF
jgi:U3 small nucleolar ribonucleoprotein component